jgi:hypothetical protein
MEKARFPHLFLPGPSVSRDDYSSPRRGGSNQRLLVQDRPSHAEHVISKLEHAWEEAIERQAVAMVDRDGAYLEFSSEPGFDLILKSLEARGSGIRLLNVKTFVRDEQEITCATVFIPRSKSGYFLRKACAYASEDTAPRKDGSTAPKNANLINSIGDVRAAILESSFWLDDPGRMPGDIADWVEVWLSSEDLAVIEEFEILCRERDIRIGEGRITFPERTVVLIKATRYQLSDLIELSDDIAEFRSANAVASLVIELENREQTALMDDLLQRTQIRNIDRTVVLLLDSGVNNGHRLLTPVLHNSDCHAVDPAWGTNDDQGHGTLMAGTAAYGDILDCLLHNHAIVINHGLESSKILPPPPEMNPKRLWGYFTSQGVSRAEIQAPNRKRIICMAITSEDTPSRGCPTSWSGQIDEMASGYTDDRRRLIILSAGNVSEPKDWANYPDSNKTTEIQDPAQAWNALTVGAYTMKSKIMDTTLAEYKAIASAGDLSPFSSTSLPWPNRKWPIKPEVLFEGGNVAQNANGDVFDTDDLKLLSTYHDPQRAQFAAFEATSVASALAANMAARIQAIYPHAWPETIRALIVHSAEWTEAQKKSFLEDDSKTAYYKLTKICGYGVPDYERAISCAANSLSLIAQATIQPFGKTNSLFVSKDMHVYRLPWPDDILRELGELHMQMRVTLSYFIEPSPGEIGWKDRYRYASHGLRFELNGPGEGELEFVQRVNNNARDEEYQKTEGANDHWLIGEARNVGSVHSDIWIGTAAELAQTTLIAIRPSVGWWRERPHLNKYNKQTHYSLVVSFTLPGQEIDIYTPVAVSLGIPIIVTIDV